MRLGYCAVCSDERRAELDAAHIAGASIRELARQFGRDTGTVNKHVLAHIPAVMQRQQAALAVREVARGDGISAEILDLQSEARRLGNLAEKSGDFRCALSAVRELVRMVELKARLLGQLRDREISVNVQAVTLDPTTARKMAAVYLQRHSEPPQLIEAAVESDHHEDDHHADEDHAEESHADEDRADDRDGGRDG